MIQKMQLNPSQGMLLYFNNAKGDAAMAQLQLQLREAGVNTIPLSAVYVGSRQEEVLAFYIGVQNNPELIAAAEKIKQPGATRL